jgi:hypothetical protein
MADCMGGSRHICGHDTGVERLTYRDAKCDDFSPTLDILT